MNKKILITIAASLLLAVFTQAAMSAQSLPAVTLEDSDGHAVSSSSLVDGKPFIVTLWATFCKPCIKELDALNEVLLDMDQSELPKIIAICVDDSRSTAKARAFAAGRGWDYVELLYDPNSDFRRAVNVNVIPHIFVYDSKGGQYYSHSGYVEGSEEELLNILKSCSK